MRSGLIIHEVIPERIFSMAAYANGDYTPGSEIILYETSVPQTAAMVGPTLGLDSQYAYVYWVQIFRTGLEAGTTITRYLTFPIDSPEQLSAPQEVVIPAEHDLAYDPFPSGSLQAGERYSLESRPFDSLTVLQDIKSNPSLKMNRPLPSEHQ